MYTFKAGLLSPLAHDLRLRVDRWEIGLDGVRVAARFWTDSIVVEGPVIRGDLRPSGLSERDKQAILATLRTDILDTARWPEIRFVGDAMSGDLTIRGRAVRVDLRSRQEGAVHVGEIELAPSLWGITPYRALGGTIRLQDRLRLTWRVSEPG